MIVIQQNALDERWNESPEEIRDAIFSDANNEILDQIGQQSSLDEKKQKDLAYLCLITFLGFISTKDIFEHIKELVGGNAKQAYEIYTVLDQQLFEPIRGHIHLFYKTHASSEVEPVDVAEPQTQAKINLKKEPAEDAINLKRQDDGKKDLTKDAILEQGPVVIPQDAKPQAGETQSPIEAPFVKRESVQTFTPQQNIPAPAKTQLFSPHTFHMRGSAANSDKQPPTESYPKAPAQQAYQATKQMPAMTQAKQQPPAQMDYQASAQPPLHMQVPSSVRQNAPPQVPMAEDQGPLILHKKEESVPIAQINKYKGYKNISAGGFLGSFGSMFSRRQSEQTAPRASVELPAPQPQANPEGGNGSDVPLRVKNFDDKPKTVHYSDYKSYLSRRDE